MTHGLHETSLAHGRCMNATLAAFAWTALWLLEPKNKTKPRSTAETSCSVIPLWNANYFTDGLLPCLRAHQIALGWQPIVLRLEKAPSSKFAKPIASSR